MKHWKTILFICLAAAAAGGWFYYQQTEPRRELQRARAALAVVEDLARASETFFKERGTRPDEINDVVAPAQRDKGYNFDYNRNGPSANRIPTFTRYRLHSIYTQHANPDIAGKIICDVYDLQYDYICQDLGGKFYVRTPDAYSLKRYVLY